MQLPDSNQALFDLAKTLIPGGVNSPVRAYGAVGGTPRMIARAEGARLYDVEGKEYIDYVGSWGPMILGHAHPSVIDAVKQTVDNGLSFGAPCPLEVELAQLVCECMPNIEQIRMVSSGTEATMTALRLARGATGRHKIIKFEGCYHGHSDSLLVKAGSGALTLGTPSSPGVTPQNTADTLVASFNDLESVERLFAENGNTIAAIIVEPIAGNMNMVLPKPGFLEGLRQLCDQYGSLLILDEVMTGFRIGLTGAQGLYGIKPDITTLGKIIGGGMPVGAIAGSREIMEQLSPTGSIYQAGTLSGNPVAMAAGIATIREVRKPGVYEKLDQLTKRLISGLLDRAKAANVPLSANHQGSMFGVFFNKEQNIIRYEQVMRSNRDHFNTYFHAMLDAGVNLAPSAFEAGFVSAAHSNDDIDQTLDKAEAAFAQINKAIAA